MGAKRFSTSSSCRIGVKFSVRQDLGIMEVHIYLNGDVKTSNNNMHGGHLGIRFSTSSFEPLIVLD